MVNNNNTFAPVATQPVLQGDDKVFSRPIFNFLNTLATTQSNTLQKYTPTSTTDTAGKVGESAFDDDFIYIKTSIGWQRIALTTF